MLYFSWITRVRCFVRLGFTLVKEPVIFFLFPSLVLGFSYCLVVTWLFCSLCLTSSVHFTCSYTEDEPSFVAINCEHSICGRFILCALLAASAGHTNKSFKKRNNNNSVLVNTDISSILTFEIFVKSSINFAIRSASLRHQILSKWRSLRVMITFLTGSLGLIISRTVITSSSPSSDWSYLRMRKTNQSINKSVIEAPCDLWSRLEVWRARKMRKSWSRRSREQLKFLELELHISMNVQLTYEPIIL